MPAADLTEDEKAQIRLYLGWSGRFHQFFAYLEQAFAAMVLMEKPAAAMTPKAPSSTTGTAMVGMIVARKFCRNRYITRNTRMTASTSVCTTPRMESFTKGVVSYGITASTPGGK